MRRRKKTGAECRWGEVNISIAQVGTRIAVLFYRYDWKGVFYIQKKGHPDYG